MPFLDKDIPFYEFKQTEKERKTLEDIYRRYVKILEEGDYPEVTAVAESIS